MYSIDEIMEMLDWNNPEEAQEEGRNLCKNIKCINLFLQPGPPYGKRVWDNCAAILSERSDEELKPYLYEMFEWLEDMNWPGTECIYDRLKQYKDRKWFDFFLNDCIHRAECLKDVVWLSVLQEFKT